jgi:hypothetical protein
VFIVIDLGGKDIDNAGRASPWKGTTLVSVSLVVFFFFFGVPLHEKYETKQCTYNRLPLHEVNKKHYTMMPYYLISIVAAMSSGFPFLHVGQ